MPDTPPSPSHVAATVERLSVTAATRTLCTSSRPGRPHRGRHRICGATLHAAHCRQGGARVATSFSVKGTARRASDLARRTVIVFDVCSAGEATHQASLASLGLLAEITTSAEAIGARHGASVRA